METDLFVYRYYNIPYELSIYISIKSAIQSVILKII